MSAVRFDQDREAARWFDSDRVAAAWFDKDLAGGAGPPPPRTLDSTAALPLSGSATLTVGIVADSSRPLPLSGSATLAAGVAADSVRALPFGGAIDATLAIAADLMAALPLSGVIDLSAVAVAGKGRAHRGRRATPAEVPPPWRPVRELGRTQDVIESELDDLLIELLI